MDTPRAQFYKEQNIQGILKPSYQLIGTWGDNNWFITCVTLKFTWNPQEVKELLVNIDNQGWNSYTSQPVNIEICADGIHSIAWKWIDPGDDEHLEPTFSIRIDKTPPIINLEKKVDSETQGK